MLFAALIGPYFINWTSYRQDFEREASRVLGQKVEVLGSAEARLLPFPSVTFNDVRVESAKTGETMMTVAHFSMDAELAPFLRGEILIFDMRIDGPRGTVRLLPDGSLDWSLRKSDDLPAKSVVLENVEITKGAIDLVDEQHDRTQEIRKLNARLSADSLAGPWHVEGTGALNGHTGAFSFSTGTAGPDGKLRMRARLLPDEEPVSIETEGDAGFDGHKPRYQGQFTLQVLDLAAISGHRTIAKSREPQQPAVARATGKFALDNARLRVSDYRLEIGPTEDPYVVTGDATIDTGKTPNFMLTATGQQIDIDRLNGRGNALNGKAGEGGKGDRPPPALTPPQRLAILHRIGDLIPIPPMPGKASIKLPAVVAGDTTVRDVEIEAEPDARSWKIDRFQGKFPGRTQVEAKGNLTLGSRFGFSGHLLVASKQPSGLADWLTGKVDPQIRLLAGAGLSANVTLTSDVQRFENLELAVGPSTIRGGFERTVPPTGRADVAMDLSGDDIDLDAVKALAGLFTGRKNGLSIADENVTAKLEADRFEAFGAQASGVDTAFGYNDGTLTIGHLKIASLAGATLSLNGSLHDLAADPAGNLHAEIHARDLKPLLTFAQVVGGSNMALDHLSGAAAAFEGTSMKVDATLQSPGLKIRAEGKAGGSDITLNLKRARLDGAPGTVPLTVELTAENNSVNKLLRQLGLQPLPIDAPGPGLLSMRLDGTPAEGAQLAVSLSGADTELDANGKLALPAGSPLTGKLALRLKSADLSPYLIMNGIGLPESPSGLPVDLRGALSLGKQDAELSQIEGSVGDNAVTGDLSLTRGGRPSVDGNLSVGEIDAGWLARLVLGPGAVTDGQGDWSTGDFAPPQDFGLDVDVALSADHAYLGLGRPARGFRSDVTLKGGTLNVGNVKAAWLGGHLEGNLKLADSSSSGLLTTQISLVGADLARVFSPDGKSAPAVGTLGFSGSFEGSGKSARALVNALAGSGAITVKNLAIRNIRTNGFSEIVKAVDGSGKDFKISAASVEKIARKAVEGGQFRAGDISVPVSVTGGKLRVSDVDLSDQAASVSADATIDLAQRTLDATLVMAFKPGEDAINGGGTPAVTLNFSGPLADPRETMDATELSNYLSLRAYDIRRRKVELIQAGVLEKQRLRRQIDLERFKAAERRRDAAIMIEERRRRDAALAARRAAAQAEAKRKADEAAAREKAQAQAAGNGNEPQPGGPVAPSPPSDPAAAPPAASGSSGSSGAGARRPAAPAPQKKRPPLNFHLPGVNEPLN